MAEKLDDPRPSVRARFQEAMSAIPAGAPVTLLGHFDADGLSALAILRKALDRSGRECETRIVGKGETPWSPEVRSALADSGSGGLIVTDLGVRAEPILPGTVTIFIDHHVPQGLPEDATVITGYSHEPQPTSALLAYWCAEALGPAEDLLWLAGLGLIGDMAEDAGFSEMAEAHARYGKTALRKAVSLINAPRRSSRADATPVLDLLLKCSGPKELLSGEHPETALLLEAKDEVAREMDAAKRTAPKVRGDVALISFDSPCQIHPLIAQQWRGRLRDKVVIAANKGYRQGWVHFAARTATPADLIAFLAERRPEGADSHYGSGHRQATGGALRTDLWNRFVEELGFPEEQIA